jgi:hypothetical protein
MPGKEKSRDVSAKEAVECIRSSMTNQELLEKFKISPKGFGDLLKQLLIKKLITEGDLTSRGISIKITKPEPASAKPPKPKRPKPKAPRPKPLIAPEPDPFDSDFLDTVTLTEMLSFKPSEAPPPRKQSDAREIPPVNDEEPIEVEDKKGKFSFTGLFKKER